jgi:hypothetical protein
MLSITQFAGVMVKTVIGGVEMMISCSQTSLWVRVYSWGKYITISEPLTTSSLFQGVGSEADRSYALLSWS